MTAIDILREATVFAIGLFVGVVVMGAWMYKK